MTFNKNNFETAYVSFLQHISVTGLFALTYLMMDVFCDLYFPSLFASVNLHCRITILKFFSLKFPDLTYAVSYR